jgi:cytochrome c oxidase subunit 2
MSQIPAPILTLVVGVIVTLISLWFGQNNGLMPEQASLQAPLVDNFFNAMLTIGTALFIVVEGAIVYFLFRFRRRAGDDTDGIPLEGNLPLEAFWTAIPAIIVIGIGVYSVDVFQQMGGFSPDGHMGMAHHSHQTVVAQAPQDAEIAEDVPTLLVDADGNVIRAKYGFGSNPEEGIMPPDLVVNVSGMQYAWLFNYPDGNIISGELHVPVGKDVQLNISAVDVIHSFWVPQFRLKQDAIPGQDTGLRFVATKEGSYPIVCAELCGSYHGGMRSTVVVHSQEDYDQWFAENQIAQVGGSEGAIAVRTTDMSEAEYLSPITDELGVDQHLLHQLHGS